MEYKYETLKVEIEDGVAVMSFNRPDKYNAMNNLCLTVELGACISALRKDPEVKVVVLTGAGKAFCSGADVDEMVNGTLTLNYATTRILDETMMMLTDMEKPVICAMNGIAAGGGSSIAMACDIIFASEKARFSTVYTNIGMVPDLGNLWYLTRLVGPNRAKDLCFTARVIDAQEMYRLGIAQEVFPADELMPKTMEYTRKLAQGPALAYMTLKNLIDRNWSLSLEQYFDMEAYSIPMLLNSEDFKEGTKAFLEKRKPVFKGR